MARYFWGGNWHTVPNPYGGSGMFAGVRVTPPPAPAAPASPATPPVDPVAEQRRILIQQGLERTEGDITAQEGDTRRQFGLDDTSDPFSRAALLKQSYDNRVRGSTNSYASSGQLYSGALQNAQNTNALNYTQGTDSLRKQQDQIIADLERRRAAARESAAMGNLDQDQANVNYGLNNPPDPLELPQNLAPQPVQTSMSIRRKKRRRR